ncbi:TOMM precursor leader peptide-binding protein [Paludibaculum fermentans]|uniref:TOMM leader peptide-binding protein n=1 Tax=Paludibaculum fermentans TaxID=1473598 RepID=A0A7S7NTB1_PALFE|nr:TOMM precursor leader peptide-binding protein [Paludibaculum fermentans]QOY89321.1 TOMM precursor leader peptide-binding protein [Paludibaculum fermentans]
MCLRRAFGSGVAYGAEWPDAAPPKLVVCLRGCEQLASRAAAAGVVCLGADFRNAEAFLGPVAIPGRAGCPACAQARLYAASQQDPVDDDVEESVAVAAPELIRAIRLILRKGPQASPLLDHILAIDTRAYTSSLHRVVPLPVCAMCGGASVHPRSASRNSGGDVMQQLSGVLDFRTGIVSRLVIESPAELGVSMPIVATAAPPHVLSADGTLRQLPIGWGKGLDLPGAIFSAVGEAVERYAPSIPEPWCIVYAAAQDLPGDCLDGHPLYSDEQYTRPGFAYVRFSKEAKQPWVAGEWLDTREPVWIPAISAYLAMTVTAEQFLCQGTSNGLASHPDREEAALRAVMELVERDAFLACWLTGTPGTRIELDAALEPALAEVIEAVRRLGAQVELYLLETAACGTAVMCLALGDGLEYPGATISLGADLDPAGALRQAILELGQTGPHLRKMMRGGALAVPARPEEVHEMMDHAAWYFDAGRSGVFDRMRAGGAIPLRTVLERRCERSLASCSAELARAGVRVALVDVTSSDIATTGLTVMRAVSMDLQPLWYGYGMERSVVPRIQRMGLRTDLPAVHPIW